MKVFHLPDLGEGLASAEIREWYVKKGECIQKDDMLVSVETAKAVLDIPAPYSGYLHMQHGQPGDVIQTGSALATIKIAGSAKEPDSTPASVVGQFAELDSNNLQTLNNSQSTSKNIVSAQPAARALARKLGINLNQCLPTDANRVVTVDDVLSISTSETHSQHAVQPDACLSGIRQQMAMLATEAGQITVPATLTESFDISKWYKKVDFFAHIAQALCQALLACPALNAHYKAHEYYTCFDKAVDLGIAIHTEHGLFVPTVQASNACTPTELRAQLDQLKSKAAQHQLTQKDMTKPTFTVSNIGALGVGRFATPMIVPPCVGTLALGAVYPSPVLIEDQWQAHPHLPISLTFDHRVVYGAEAARFLRAFSQNLQHVNP